jgi:hypothetical protein
VHSRNAIRKGLCPTCSPMQMPWLAWARSLRSGRTRTARFGRAVMKFLRPHRLTRLSRESRWLRILQQRSQGKLLISLLVWNRPAKDLLALLLSRATPLKPLLRTVAATPVRTLSTATAHPPGVERLAVHAGRTFLPARQAPAHTVQLDLVHRQGALQRNELLLTSRQVVAGGGLQIELPARRVRRQTRRAEQVLLNRASLVIRRPAAQRELPVKPSSPEKFAPSDQVVGSDQHRWWQAASPAQASKVELLTDEVIRQIDRRIIARRERMGKT